MSKIDKLLKRLHSRPKDFTWDESSKVLDHFGFKEIRKGKTGGSRRKFVNENMEIISLHEPHPEKILKVYQIDLIIKQIKPYEKLF